MSDPEHKPPAKINRTPRLNYTKECHEGFDCAPDAENPYISLSKTHEAFEIGKTLRAAGLPRTEMLTIREDGFTKTDHHEWGFFYGKHARIEKITFTPIHPVLRRAP